MKIQATLEEIDILIAKKAMEWRKRTCDRYEYSEWVTNRGERTYLFGEFTPTTDTRFLPEIMNKLSIVAVPVSAENGRQNWYAFSTNRTPINYTEIILETYESSGVTHEDFNMAICLEALNSVGINVEVKYS